MPISAYKSTLRVLVALLVLAIVAISFLLYTHGPRVRLVRFEKDPQASSLNRGSSITITFDRPIRSEDYSQQIYFLPEVAFSAQTTRQAVVLTLGDNLQHDTEYTLYIKPGITDQTGRQMKNEHRHNFKTGGAQFMYLERNYGTSPASDQEADDYIKLSNLSKIEETIFSAPQINQFAANKNYLVVATREENHDRLFTVDLTSGDIREELLLFVGRVNNLTISPIGQIALYTITPEYSAVTPEYYEKVVNRVESLDLAQGTTQTLTNQNDEVLRSFSPIRIDPSGQIALIEDKLQTYYAVSPFNDYDPTLIGARTAAYGFTADSTEIIFQDNEGFSRYNIETGESSFYALNPRGFIQSVTSAGNYTFYSSINYIDEQPKNYVQKQDNQKNDGAELLWASTDASDTLLRDFSVSYDASLLALQINPNQCTYDTITTNSQCVSAQTIIYDTAEDEIVAEINGFDVTWLP